MLSQKDFFSGLMFTVIGGAFSWGAREYEIGEAAWMGPGYFPFVLGILLATLGMVIMFKSFTSGLPGGNRIGAFAWPR